MDPTGTLYTWVRATADAHPAAPALEVQGRVLSYSELLDVADRLAGRLVEANGRPPRAVGLLAARSLAAYAGYLAALRCGATVVPLNPKFPATRNRNICILSNVDVVVVDDEGTGRAAEVTSDVTSVALLGPWEEQLRPWDGPVPADLDAVAYTLFTSGSTGDPKGVSIRHRNVRPYIEYCVDRYGAGPGCRFSQTFDLTFDPSVFDMFVSWCSGATLVVPQNDEILTPVRFINERRITHWFAVPSVVSIAQRLRMLRPGCMPDLRWSLYGGEQLTVGHARAWAAAAPNSKFENLYGPTEITIACVGYRVPAEWPATSNSTVPIGQIYPHLEAVLLDENGTATDDGELCVRGPQRFDGYVDPAHNAGRFVRYEPGGQARDHDGTPTPDCWYRTGDRVRYENGEMVHLGRLDDQIKVSGYRVELGEIESALRAHPAVTDVMVVAVTGDDGVTELHTVYTGTAVDDADLENLVAVLPSYMRPRGYHHREAMPTNANGKIDRRRLATELTEPAPVS
ncbi:amino acid adenylation domain-containing protein [Actinocrispum wychmicini]|uniref:Amino acid adenylation domain-containing protein n=1 Tax=Actinocrispum wychmicini TaxID=1213861 RepID=A0A4R2JNZ3_9PSEU|nr:amino acid adenylation domain-containing protein [Actinocrispum wychmicini]TCO60707.1 amino acid adenylation domain-containing protein [Actinocrispum wychmicini]